MNSNKSLDFIEVKSRKIFWYCLFKEKWFWKFSEFGAIKPHKISCSLSHSLSHTITLTFRMDTRRFKPYLYQLEILAGANQLSYKVFGQLQIVYILERSNMLFPKSFSRTSLSWYPSRFWLCSIDEAVWDAVKIGWAKLGVAKFTWDKAALSALNANSKALNAIFCGVSPDEFHRISHIIVAKEAWQILGTIY